MSLRNKHILITGGAGTLGKAIIQRSIEKEWGSQITVFSTDVLKHHALKRQYPHVRTVVGDVRDYTTLYNAMVGMDVVVHAAAVKHIPDSEVHSIDTYQINVEGSMNVAQVAMQHGIPDVIGISTDKVCHAANAYGATKYLMEKIFQEFSRLNTKTNFHLVRYGNVLESTASVIVVWKDQIARGEPIRITDENMTRYWLAPADAAFLVEMVMNVPSGHILIPKMKALSIGQMMGMTIGQPPYGIEKIPLRPGEKIHETLLTEEEAWYAVESDDFVYLRPTTSPREIIPLEVMTSETAPSLTKDELMELLDD